MLARPFVSLIGIFHYSSAINLESWENENDIKTWLQPQVEQLYRKHLLQCGSDCENISTTLARRSQGMLLWARLVIQYLSNRSLSPRERRDVIFDAEILDGINNLYDKILGTLGSALGIQRSKIHRIFQVMVVAPTRLTLLELRQFIATVPGRVTRSDDLIVNLEDALPVMCGALVEMDRNGYVQFIHSSFREYLIDQHFSASAFTVDCVGASLMVSTLCISYVTYDIPRGQITRKQTEVASDYHELLSKEFPLLKYATLWLSHGRIDPEVSIRESQAASKQDIRSHLERLLDMSSAWLNQRLCVTAWIECSYFYRYKPTIAPFMSMLLRIGGQFARENTQFARFLQSLDKLEKDLSCLREEWSQILFEEPSAIWTSTVTAFNTSMFWLEALDTKITTLNTGGKDYEMRVSGGDSRGTKSILLKSQTSEDGLLVGSALVIPSRFRCTTAF